MKIKQTNKTKLWLEDHFKIETIDSMHNSFIEILYDVEDILIKKESISPIIQRLKEYTDQLKEEEKLIQEACYTESDKHINMHKLFIAKVDEFVHEFNYDNPFLASNILNFLKKWLISHILIEDKMYREVVFDYLNNSKIKLTS